LAEILPLNSPVGSAIQLGSGFTHFGPRETQMKRFSTSLTLLILLTAVFPAVAVTDDNEGNHGNLKAFLSGYQEVPALSTTGNGFFIAKLKDPSTLEYKLSFSSLEGSPTLAHIHFGQPGVEGGIMANLCGDGVKPACTLGQEITGTIIPADILDLTTQGVEPGNFEEALRAIQSGNSYVNVISDVWTGGEIRGQILPHRFGPDQGDVHSREQVTSQSEHKNDHEHHD
jgi:hypothetical protein